MSAKRLHEVVWSGRCYVIAENSADAIAEASMLVPGAENIGLDFDAWPATSVIPGWADERPVNGEPFTTCAAILAEQAGKGAD